MSSPVQSLSVRLQCASLTAILLLAGIWSAVTFSARVSPSSGKVTAVRSSAAAGMVGDIEETTLTSAPATSTTSTTSTTRWSQARVPAVPPRVAEVIRTPAPVPAIAPVLAKETGPDIQARRCQDALAWVGAAGLVLPGGWGYRCPGPALDEQGAGHWGLACLNCDGGNFVEINIALVGSSEATLHYVVAHEICHSIDYATLGLTTELTADLCAALHGAPRP